jgi:hypothetical protein
MNRNYQKSFLYLSFIFLITLAIACKTPPEEEKKSGTINEENNPIATQIRERGEQVTKELARQKEVKASIQQLPVIESFTRETEDREVIAKFGEPASVKELKLENTDQRVFYYTKENFAIWLWRRDENKGPFQFRAAVSLKNGKFDMPLHNVLTEAELKMTQVNVDNPQ